MWGRHQNFEDPSTGARDIRKTKSDLLGFFGPPLLVLGALTFYISYLFLISNKNIKYNTLGITIKHATYLKARRKPVL